MTDVLDVDAVSRSFGDRQVLKDVSFTVAAGRMTGFVGANGAGKTTTTVAPPMCSVSAARSAASVA